MPLDARSDSRPAPRAAADATRDSSFDVALDRADRSRPSRAARDSNQIAERRERDESERQIDEVVESPAIESDLAPGDAPPEARPVDAAAAALLVVAPPEPAAAPTISGPSAVIAAAANGETSPAGAISAAAGSTAPSESVDIAILGGLASGATRASRGAGPPTRGPNDSAVAATAGSTLAAVADGEAPAGEASGASRGAGDPTRGQNAGPTARAAAIAAPTAVGGDTDPNEMTADAMSAIASATMPAGDSAAPGSRAEAALGPTGRPSHPLADAADAAAASSATAAEDPSHQPANRPASATAADGQRPLDGIAGVATDPPIGVVGDVRPGDSVAGQREVARPGGVERRDAVEQVLDRANLFSTPNGRGMTIRLDPPELGMLHVRVVVESGQVSLRIATETPQARDIIRDGWAKLQEGFAQRGLRVEQVVVEQASAGQGAGLGFGSTFGGNGNAWGRRHGDLEAPVAQRNGRQADANGSAWSANGQPTTGRASLVDVRV